MGFTEGGEVDVASETSSGYDNLGFTVFARNADRGGIESYSLKEIFAK